MSTTGDRLTVNDFAVDMRVATLLAAHVRRRAVTRVFGLSEEDQTFLVSLAVLGGAATVLGGLAVRGLPRPSGGDLALGGAVINTGLGGLVGPTAAPLAGALIGFALVAHAVRPALARSVHGVVQLEHDARTGFRTFLGEMPRRPGRKTGEAVTS